MLSQFDSEHKNHIRRTKSASSVKERRKHPIISEPLDPESSRIQALIAAHRAIDRSRGSASDDLRRTDSSASRTSARTAAVRYADGISPAEQLRRQRSILQASAPSLAGNLPVPSSKDLARVGDLTYTQVALSEFGYDGTHEGEPSSFRKLRRSRSVVETRRG